MADEHGGCAWTLLGILGLVAIAFGVTFGSKAIEWAFGGWGCLAAVVVIAILIGWAVLTDKTTPEQRRRMNEKEDARRTETRQAAKDLWDQIWR